MSAEDRIARAVAVLREGGMPDCLNRWLDMTPEKVEALMAQKIGPREQALRESRAAALTEARRVFNPFAEEQAARAREKSRGRIAALKAKLSGATARMPPSGKQAAALIAAETPDVAPAQHQETAMTTLEAIAAGAETPVAPKTKTKRKKAVAPPPAPKKKAAPKVKTKAKPKAKKKDPVAASFTVREGSKLALVVALLTRPEGCTTADVLKATGWPTVSMPQQAKAAGLKLRKEKDGSVSRYFGS